MLGAVRAAGLDKLLDRSPSRVRDLALAMIAARVVDPRSKLANTRAWTQSTLADELGAAMDRLLERQRHIEKGLVRRDLGEGALVLYDSTSIYFEGHCCPLAQLVSGLLTDAQGCPIAVEVFAGHQSRIGRAASRIESPSAEQPDRQTGDMWDLDGIDTGVLGQRIMVIQLRVHLFGGEREIHEHGNSPRSGSFDRLWRLRHRVQR